MAIQLANPPPAWLDRAPAILEAQLSGRASARSKAFFHLSAPVPKVAVDPQDVRGSFGRSLVSWEAFLVGDGELGLGSVTLEDGELAYAGAITGDFAERSLEAAALGQGLLGEARAVYHPIFVECAPAAIFSLLFKPRRGPARYVNILEGSLVEPDRLELRLGLSSLIATIERNSVQQQVRPARS